MSSKETKTPNKDVMRPTDGKVLIHSLVPPTYKHPAAPPRPKPQKKDR